MFQSTLAAGAKPGPLEGKGTVPRIDGKIIKVKSRVLGNIMTFPPFPIISVHAAPEHTIFFFIGRSIADYVKIGCGTVEVTIYCNTEMDGLLLGNSSQRISVRRISGIKHTGFPPFYENNKIEMNSNTEKYFRKLLENES